MLQIYDAVFDESSGGFLVVDGNGVLFKISLTGDVSQPTSNLATPTEYLGFAVPTAGLLIDTPVPSCAGYALQTSDGIYCVDFNAPPFAAGSIVDCRSLTIVINGPGIVDLGVGGPIFTDYCSVAVGANGGILSMHLSSTTDSVQVIYAAGAVFQVQPIGLPPGRKRQATVITNATPLSGTFAPLIGASIGDRKMVFCFVCDDGL